MRGTTLARPLVVAAVLVGTLTAVGPSPAEATFPGNNGRIAFSLGEALPGGFPSPSQVYTVRPDGTGRRQLTHVPADKTASSPAWSPDGRRIAYQSNVDGDFQLWVMNADGSAQTRLLDDPGFAHYQPSWSPDGGTLVFSRCDRSLGFDAYCDLATVDADGSWLRTLLGGNWIHTRPRVSPDGTKIVFNSTMGGLLSAIWVINVDGSGVTRLTDPAVEGFWPDWSPDGRHIVFTDFCCLPLSNVLVMNADGSGIRFLTHLTAPRQSGFASYSPDGRKVVLLATPPGGGESNVLATINIDGSGLRPITGARPELALSDWGPSA
ncbi:MAG: PD40 domain-containing protein [Geodermatophilaceae bacterium]|nr:PD40 domain-containing protein [Geodermatophilaceae bacterium]